MKNQKKIEERIMELFCLLGFHKWNFEDYWFPSFTADVVTHHFQIAICERCGKEELSGYFVKEKYDKIETNKK